jgi:hypothetical protein
MTAEIFTSINPVLMTLLPILYTIAELLKKTPVKNWMIPFILWGVSIVLTIIFLFIQEISADNVFIGIIQGTLIAMMTVGGNQFIKQATEKRLTDNTKKGTKKT